MQLIIAIYATQNMMILKLGMRFVIIIIIIIIIIILFPIMLNCISPVSGGLSVETWHPCGLTLAVEAFC